MKALENKPKTSQKLDTHLKQQPRSRVNYNKYYKIYSWLEKGCPKVLFNNFGLSLSLVCASFETIINVSWSPFNLQLFSISRSLLNVICVVNVCRTEFFPIYPGINLLNKTFWLSLMCTRWVYITTFLMNTYKKSISQVAQYVNIAIPSDMVALWEGAVRQTFEA